MRMFDCQELKLSKQYFEWKLGAPPSELTKEELLLKSKYEKLREAKEQLRRYRTTGSCKSPIKISVVHKPVNVPKLKENFSKKTTDFKNWSKQAQGNIKRSYPLCSFEDDAQPRSVKVKGENLTEEFLHKHSNKFGEIWKIRTNEERTCSVLTFKRPSNAAKFAKALNGAVIEGVKLDISILRKNTSWNFSDCNKHSEMKNEGKSVHLRYKGHLTTADFEEFFHGVGRITRIYLNQAKHFGFAMFETEEEAQRAINELDGEVYKGSRVFVSTQTFSKCDFSKPVPQSFEYNKDREMVTYEDLDGELNLIITSDLK